MNKFRDAEAESTACKLVTDARRAKREAEIAVRVGALVAVIDELKDGDILTWDKLSPNEDDLYRYAAIRSGGDWYITARSGGYSTERLIIELIALGIDAPQLTVFSPG